MTPLQIAVEFGAGSCWQKQLQIPGAEQVPKSGAEQTTPGQQTARLLNIVSAN
jgi:hypothetical protein